VAVAITSRQRQQHDPRASITSTSTHRFDLAAGDPHGDRCDGLRALEDLAELEQEPCR
jgi:hypothetical protein